jgi:hypothetical protein
LNAKELILGYINATPLTAGFYMSGLAYNISMKKIFELMDKPLIRKFTEYVSKNPFSQEMFKGLDKIVENAIIDDKGNVVIQTLTEYETEEGKGIAYLPDESATQSLSELGVKDQAEFEMLRTEFLKLSTLSDEYKLLGQLLGLNQGLKYDSFEFYNFAQKLSKQMDTAKLSKELERLGKTIEKLEEKDTKSSFGTGSEQVNDLKIKRTALSNTINELKSLFALTGMGTKFDLSQYIKLLKNKEANKEVLDKFKMTYSGLVDYINHLALLESPQVLAQLQVYDTQTNVNQLIANNDKFADMMTKNEDRYEKDTFNKYRRVFSEVVVDKYINEKSAQFNVVVSVDYNSGKRDVPIDFKEPSHREFFLKWFDFVFMSKLKEKYPNNKFVNNLIAYEKKGVLGTKLFSNVFLADNLGKVMLKYILREDFNKIYNESIVVGANTYQVGEMFKIYNLIQYSNRPIRDSFTVLMPIEDMDDYIRFENTIDVNEFNTAEYKQAFDEHFDNNKNIHRKFSKNNKRGNIKFDYEALLENNYNNIIKGIKIGIC